MKGKYPNGLRALIEARNIRPVDLARSVDTSPQNINRFVHGERKLTRDWAERIAPHIPGASPAELVFAPSGSESMKQIPLGDLVSAGRFAEIPTRLEEELPMISVGLGDGDWIAFDVVGDSMNLIAPEGSRIFVDRSERDLMNGKYYVVVMGDGATFKKFRSSPARLEPVSSNIMHEPIFLSKEYEIKVIGRVKKLINDF